MQQDPSREVFHGQSKVMGPHDILHLQRETPRLKGSLLARRSPYLQCSGDSERDGSNPTCVDRPLRTREGTSVMSRHHRSSWEEWELWMSRGWSAQQKGAAESKTKLMSRKQGYLVDTPACVYRHASSTPDTVSVMSYNASRFQGGPRAAHHEGQDWLQRCFIDKNDSAGIFVKVGFQMR